MAPYAIAHLKIGLKLTETGYRFASKERARVYLTNSLEPCSTSQQVFADWFPALAAESQEVNEVKISKKFTVIFGNPPYSKSLTSNAWINGLLDDFKRGINEKKSDLTREEWKFLRIAIWHIERSTVGVMSYVVNNAFLSAPTHRQLRKFFIDSNDQVYILDLHGDANKGETAPDGSEDKNVFDIKQGVCVFAATKNSRAEPSAHPRTVRHQDMFGSRATKYDKLGWLSVGHPNAGFETRTVDEPWCFLYRRDINEDSPYPNWFAINAIFVNSNTGIQTKNDDLFVSHTRNTLDARMKRVLDEIDDNEAVIRREFELSDSAGWKVSRLKGLHFDAEKNIAFLYKPFDIRRIYFEPSALGRARVTTMRHMLRENIALVATRQFTRLPFGHVFVSRFPIEEKTGSHDRTTQLFPLFLYGDGLEDLFCSAEPIPAIAATFISVLAAALGLEYSPQFDRTVVEGQLSPFDVFSTSTRFSIRLFTVNDMVPS